ncbi:hypothetical protein JQK88_29790 [Mesorhizobium caraganae]|uniref:hypothetical protein n=1 Tax=Mesorhizobium caraganae TaxID=483206 RepID=UPI0019398C20|nr:hypothetical protein [Mesorhizobium caraganae]MBM2715326.1 hypothetical protein [Mesorhizobium caraganae]
MRVTSLYFLSAGLTMPVAPFAEGEVSVERGLQVSIMGGCHDCHTEGYSESEGKIDPEKALMGQLGWLARSLGHDLCDQSSDRCFGNDREWIRRDAEAH